MSRDDIKDLDDIKEIEKKRELEEIIELQTEQLKKEFNEMDLDHNGVLSYDELLNFLSIKSKAKNKDSKPQDLDTFKKLISSIDQNHDGQISL